jgi:hypothetical protein
MVDAALEVMSAELESLYASRGGGLLRRDRSRRLPARVEGRARRGRGRFHEVR